jgi:GrpB-like predicted nucleotidyltransferase (UPF0157 family)
VIVLAPYDAAWPARFDAEAALLRQAFGALALRVDHVGSTAVPGLAAKPVIDLQLSVRRLAPRDAFDAALARLGYRHVPLGDFDSVYPFFQKPAAWPSTHHVHLCEAGGEQEWRHLAFRDALRADAELAAAYVRLKHRLAREHDGATPASREAYSLAKSDFVAAALARALPAPLFGSTRFTARELAEADLPRLQAFYDANPEYFLTINGSPPAPDAARADFDDRPPPHLPYGRRWFAGLFEHGGPMVGVAEVVADLGAEGVWHVGLFLVATRLHGGGAAQELYAALEGWTAREGARWLRLGVVAGNVRAERFWAARGFAVVRVREGVDTGGRLNDVRVLVKPLAGDDAATYLGLVPRDRPDSTLP